MVEGGMVRRSNEKSRETCRKRRTWAALSLKREFGSLVIKIQAPVQHTVAQVGANQTVSVGAGGSVFGRMAELS